jgi:hypothetical protein
MNNQKPTHPTRSTHRSLGQPAAPDDLRALADGLLLVRYQTEWGTDVMFEDPRTLAEIYPSPIRHAMHHSESRRRALSGQRRTEFYWRTCHQLQGPPRRHPRQALVRGNSSRCTTRPADPRIETTIAKTTDFKSCARLTITLKPDWRPLRKGKPISIVGRRHPSNQRRH